ncbi:MAG: signal recognition particle protein [Deltaproteobacteria bacterium]|nr:signal recognition particle protein [Deltaproteobacteria bacterium]
MLEAVTKGFKAARRRFGAASTVDPAAIELALRDIRMSLLDGDVEISVVRTFLEGLDQRAREELVAGTAKVVVDGKEKEITAYHRFIAICQEELEKLMGQKEAPLEYAPLGVTAIMLVGLQGSGKTTTCAKLARWLTEREQKKVLMVAADLQRPAAVDQLEQLGAKIDVPVFADRMSDPLELCGAALARAGKQKKDIVLFDTAGRLAIDEVLMNELRLIKDRTKPQEILLVVDSMIGQDAVRTAKAFDDALGVTGFVMTKLDGDARGGAALSIKSITGKPIKFLGVGEGMDGLEVFRPDGLASRILGMGDVVGLVKEFERRVDQDKAEADAERMFRGQFDFADFVEQIRILRSMGSLKDLLAKMPMFQDGFPDGMRPDEREFVKIEAVHDSMTPLERRRPALVREPSRTTRIATGIGRRSAEVIDVLNRYDLMRRMMIALGDQPSLLSKLPGFDQLAQVRKVRGMDLSELFGDLFQPEKKGANGGVGDENDDEEEPPTANAPQRPKREYFAHLGKPKGPKPVDKAKKKEKRRAAEKAKKKSRKK